MFAEKAASLESTSALAMAEVGQQCLLRGKVKEAQRYYKVLINNRNYSLETLFLYQNCFFNYCDN